MFTSFFQARAALDAAIRADEITRLSSAALAIFRLLLEHTFFTEARYGYVNDGDNGVKGIDDIAKLTGNSSRTVKRALPELEAARLIHRQARPNWNGGRRPDEIAIIWATFHAEDEADPAAPSEQDVIEGANTALSDQAEGANLSTEGANVALSFLSKKVEEPTSSRRADDVAVATPSGKTKDRAKASARTSSTQPGSSARAGKASSASSKVPGRSGARAGDEPRGGFPDLSEYVSDLERCAGDLEVRLYGVDDGQIDIEPLARSLRALCLRYGFTCLWSEVIEVFSVESSIWLKSSRKGNPVGYFLFLLEKDMAQQRKIDGADDAGLEKRFLDLFVGRECLPGHRISELMPDMDFETFQALKARLLNESKIKMDPARPNTYLLAA